MKLDKIKFGRLIAHCVSNGMSQGEWEIDRIDELVDVEMPVSTAINVSAADVDRLMALMAAGNQKIEAIKQYRVLTGLGLKESKEAVERYWGNSSDTQLLARIKQALGTTADGDELIAFAKRASLCSGAKIGSEEPATLGDILHSTGLTKAGNNIG